MLNTNDDSFDDLFEDIFIAEIDSWFSADLVCCNKCYDSLFTKWPLLAKRNIGLYFIDISTFYEGSKTLSCIYTRENYLMLLNNIKCPRCNFAIEKGFSYCNFSHIFENENEIQELQTLIVKTPLIVLQHPLAKRIFKFLKILYHQCGKKSISNTLYRGRILPHKVSNEMFLPPLKEYVNEGRYNHIGIPVFYLANHKETCFKELRKPDKNFYVAEIKIDTELKLLDLRSIEEIDNDNIFQVLIISSLLSSKVKDDCKFKPEYFFSRFIADCCKYIGFDGVIYPSIQCDKGFNYVLFNTDVITIENVIKYEHYNLE